jgi:hypothetical protein
MNRQKNEILVIMPPITNTIFENLLWRSRIRKSIATGLILSRSVLCVWLVAPSKQENVRPFDIDRTMIPLRMILDYYR